MSGAYPRRLFLLATLLAAVNSSAFAQPAGPNRSHGPIPQLPTGAPIDRAQLQTLEQRLQAVQQYEQLQDWLRKGEFNPQDVKDLERALRNKDAKEIEDKLKDLLKTSADKEKVPFDPNNPLVQELAKEFSKHPPDWIQQWAKMPQPGQGRQPSSSGKTQPPGSGHEAGLPPPSPERGTPGQAKGNDRRTSPPSSNSPPLPSPPASSPPPNQSQPWVAEIEKWAANHKVLKDSPALRQTLEDLARTHFQFDTDATIPRAGDSTLGERMAQWVGDRLPSESFWDKTVLPKVRSLPMPALPSINLPSLNFSKPSMPSVDLPAVNLPAPPSNTRAEVVFLSVLTVAVVALILWKFFGGLLRRKGRLPGLELVGATAPADFRSLDLSALTSRADVIRAFETLSLIRLGSAARSWNHHHLAAGLGGNENARRQMANHLASLYEQARYAPGDGPLPADALRAAQHELAILAGVERA